MAELITAALKTGNKSIAVTGTAVTLSADNTVTVLGVVISAPSTNVGPIYIGASGVTNTAGAAGNGYALFPGKDVPLPVQDLSKVFINGTANDYVTWVAE